LLRKTKFRFSETLGGRASPSGFVEALQGQSLTFEELRSSYGDNLPLWLSR